jgi:hypothetical protein
MSLQLPPDDVGLRACFALLRAERTARAGAFDATLHAAASRAQRRRTTARLPIAILAGAPLVIAIVLVGRQRADARAAAAVAARIEPLVEWRSPTETLLQTPYYDWLRAPPALHASVIMVHSPDSGAAR